MIPSLRPLLRINLLRVLYVITSAIISTLSLVTKKRSRDCCLGVQRFWPKPREASRRPALGHVGWFIGEKITGVTEEPRMKKKVNCR